MKRRMMDILCCPQDKCSLELREESVKQDEVESGVLKCSRCQAEYPIRNCVPRFVDTDSYVDSFSMEWQIHSRTQMPDGDNHETVETFRNRASLTREEMQGKLVLDAGCGVGRYMSVASQYGAEVIGVDLSFSVEQAMENVGHDPQCHVIQADLTNLPFDVGTFDYVFSLGVLHHMPDPPGGFKALVPLLKPGGDMAVSVYSSHSPYYPYTASRRLRKVTVHMNKRLLYMLTSVMALVLYPIYRIPFVKVLFMLAPISMHPEFAWRQLDTFDCYSPRYQFTYTYREVFQWFREQGFVDMEVLEAPVSMRGHRPLTASVTGDG